MQEFLFIYMIKKKKKEEGTAISVVSVWFLALKRLRESSDPIIVGRVDTGPRCVGERLDLF